MKKIANFCLIAVLSTSIISGCAQDKDNEKAQGKGVEKVEAQ